MIPVEAITALEAIATALARDPSIKPRLTLRWQSDGRESAGLPDDVRAAADVAHRAMRIWTRSKLGAAELGELLPQPAAPALLAWCTASSARREAQFAGLLRNAQRWLPAEAAEAARARVVEGPLLDALGCAPLLVQRKDLEVHADTPEWARMEILMWEAGASALEAPDLGPWIWGSREVFDVMVGQPATGGLRRRSLAARCLEVTCKGMPAQVDPALKDWTLKVLPPLLLHPEPLVWVHAGRALGRLSGQLPEIEETLAGWLNGQSRVLRTRAMTALASMPAAGLTRLGPVLSAAIDSPDESAAVLGALSAATPYLFFERRDLWERLVARVLAGNGGSLAARALARGLVGLWRRGAPPPEVEAPLRALREIARTTPPASLEESRRWLDVISTTDVVDGAERDRLDLELGLENLTRVAAQYDDEEADARAARFAGSIAPTFNDAYTLSMNPKGRLRRRAAAMNALEGCARSFALRLWAPLLATPVGTDPAVEPDLEETWTTITRAPGEILDLVKERKAAGGDDPEDDLALEVLAIRLGGYLLDACGAGSGSGARGGPVAHGICLWLRRVEGLADRTREIPAVLADALSTLLWRLVDTTRGTSLGQVGDVEWIGPFAAWFALVIDQPTMLLEVAAALPGVTHDTLVWCCNRAQALRTAVLSGAPDGKWGPAAAEALGELKAHNTELGDALADLAKALAGFSRMSGQDKDLDAACLHLVVAGARVQGALSNPVKALHPATQQSPMDSLSQSATQNAPRVSQLVARAVRTHEAALLDVWFATVGPTVAPLLQATVREAIKRTPAPPAPPVKKTPTVVVGYELVRPLGEGAMGKVWLVRKPGADRLFVLKVPKKDALMKASEVERPRILASFEEEAKALAGLYHPNVLNIVDRGVIQDMPFLVLELLIGADLQQYSEVQRMSLVELERIVLDACAGLAALHAAGLVHRDIKPANLWLRLPLANDEPFDGAKHRDSTRTHPLSTVVIDFGMVRAQRVPADVCGRFVAGTAGFIAPEQVQDPAELDPRADVYSLAATIYKVHTGRAFFDDLTDPLDRLRAHMRQDPFEDSARLKPFPAAMAKLLRAATALRAKDRPGPIELGRAFVAAT